MEFDPQPTLRGPTITARPLRPEDLEPLYAVASDPLLWAQHPSPDRHRRDVFESFFAEALASGGALTVHTDNRAVIGSSRFRGDDEGRSQVEIGWTFLARPVWGGAANRELKNLMLAHAFRFVDRVVFNIGADNLRSRRAVEKLGARVIGTTPRPPGPDWVVYAIDRRGGR